MSNTRLICIALLAAAVALSGTSTGAVIPPSTTVTPSNAKKLGFEVYFGGCDAYSGYCSLFVRVPVHVHLATWYVPDRKGGGSFVDLRIVTRSAISTIDENSTATNDFFAHGFRGVELRVTKDHIATSILAFATLKDATSERSTARMIWEFGMLSQWVDLQ